MKKFLAIFIALVTSCTCLAQTKVITTGNNTINPSDPYAADIVIGSDANGGTRHDSNIMFWSSGSASRIWNSNDILCFSQWATTNPNVALNAAVGGPSYFQGNLGIGTTSPQFSLDINKLTSSLNLNGTGFGNSGALINLLGWANSSRNWQIGVANIGYDGLMFTPSTTTGGTAFTTPAMIINSNGNVGIGTTSANANLHLVGTFLSNGNNANLDSRNLNYLANSAQLLVGWNRLGGYGETDFISNQGAGSLGGFSFRNYDNAGNESELMWIRGDGNVAIGTYDPKGYKLAIAGSAIAESMTVKLQANWPDYATRPITCCAPYRRTGCIC